MKEQLTIIRKFMQIEDLATAGEKEEALTALAKLEALVGQGPVGHLVVKDGPPNHGTVFGGFVFENGTLPAGTHEVYAVR